MKRALFIASLLFSCSVFSQQWSPFIASDTLVQYKSDNVARASHFNFGFSNGAYVIQSISVKRTHTQSNNTVIEFEKGYPLAAAGSSSYSIYGNGPLVKGRLLGDSLIISSDSSVFKTIDSSGFRLSFPHTYAANQQWTFGRSVDFFMVATVDSVYQDTILGSQLDSLALFSLTVFDLQNQRDTAHKFDKVNLLVSKQNGLIKTADFTELQDSTTTTFEKFPISNQALTANDYHLLSVGDEYHYENRINGWDGFYESRQHISKIISDTTLGIFRTILIEDRWRDIHPPNNKGIDTTQKVFNINTIIHDKKSMIVSQSDLRNGYGRTQMLFYRLNHPLAFLFEHETWYSLSRVNVIDSLQTINMVPFESANFHYGPIGYPFSRREFRSFGFLETKETSQVYCKRGNIAVGTPYVFTVGVRDNGSLDRQIITYPNPVKDNIEIQTDLNVDRAILFAISGKLLLDVSNPKHIDIGHLNSGAYILRVITEKGVVTKKVLKE